jgi:hypothetical protein
MAIKTASKSADFESPQRFTQGPLIKTSTGRWSIGENWELTSGECFAVCIGHQWLEVRMEHNGRNYYTIPGIVLHIGLEARQVWGEGNRYDSKT